MDSTGKGACTFPAGFFDGLGIASRQEFLAHWIDSGKGTGSFPTYWLLSVGLGTAAKEDWLTHLIGRDNPSYHLRRLPMLVFEGVDGDMIKRVSAIIGTECVTFKLLNGHVHG